MDLSFSEYKTIVESSPNMIWRSGKDTKCNYFNNTWLKFTGKTLEEEFGDGWLQGVHPDDIEFCANTYLKAFDERRKFEMDYRLQRHDGQWRWINDRGVPFFDDNGEFAGYIGSCMDVTDQIEGKKLTEMAHNDKLTGIYNRNYLQYLLEYEFQKAKLEHTDFIVLMMDIDKFKWINDSFGHGFGDKVLHQVAENILESIRKTDIVGRYGGDEFLVILPKTSLDEAHLIAQRIIETAPELTERDTIVEVRLSIGIAKYEKESDVNMVIEKADIAMYRAKQAGGDQYWLGS